MVTLYTGVELPDCGRTWWLGARVRMEPAVDVHLKTQHSEAGSLADRDHGFEQRSAFRM